MDWEGYGLEMLQTLYTLLTKDRLCIVYEITF